MNFNGFRDLDAWKKGIGLANSIYEITENFPKKEIYGLASQMQRAAVSIPSNIAEGYRRRQDKDNIRFLRIALGSCAELETQLEIAYLRKYINKEHYDIILDSIDHQGRMIMKYLQYISGKAGS